MIAVVNKSAQVNDADYQAMVLAVNHQVRYHLDPAWDLQREYVLAKHESEVKSTDKIVYILDNADVAGALGYHDEDPHGRPYARVFVDPTLQNGGSIRTGDLAVSSV